MMGQEVFLSDNSGNRVAPGIVSADPVLASGILLTDATIAADHEQTVVAGATYIATLVSAASTLGMNFGLADVTVDANVLWTVVPYESILIHIPEGYTTLHYEGEANAVSVRLRKLSR